MTASDLAGRAQSNMLTAQRDFGGERIVVRGVVRYATLTSRESVVRTDRDYQARAEKVRENLPVVVLEPGSVLCYFEPEHLDQAAELKVGDEVALKCVVDSFREGDVQAVAVLAGCRRQK